MQQLFLKIPISFFEPIWSCYAFFFSFPYTVDILCSVINDLYSKEFMIFITWSSVVSDKSFHPSFCIHLVGSALSCLYGIDGAMVTYTAWGTPGITAPGIWIHRFATSIDPVLTYWLATCSLFFLTQGFKFVIKTIIGTTGIIWIGSVD